jgi:hypothetical protein
MQQEEAAYPVHGQLIIKADPGFELLLLAPTGLTYRKSPIVAWRFMPDYWVGAPTDCDYWAPIPVTVAGWEWRKGRQAIRYPDGQVCDGQPTRTFKDVRAWLAAQERRVEAAVNRAVETGQGFTFKAKTAA